MHPACVGRSERLAVEFVGFVAALLASDGDGKVVELAGDLRVVVAEYGPFDVRLGEADTSALALSPRLSRQMAEVAEIDGDLVMVGWLAGPKISQGAFERVFGFVDSVLLEEGGTENGEILCDEVTVGSELALPNSTARAAAGAAWSGLPRARASPAMLCHSDAVLGWSGPSSAVTSSSAST